MENKLVESAKEALAIARGDQPAADLWHNGHRYIPANSLLPLTPEAIAAAWATWRPRYKASLGPGPGFVEAVEAAIKAQIDSTRGGESDGQ